MSEPGSPSTQALAFQEAYTQKGERGTSIRSESESESSAGLLRHQQEVAKTKTGDG